MKKVRFGSLWYEFFKIEKDIGGEDSRVYRKALAEDGSDKDRRTENYKTVSRKWR